MGLAGVKCFCHSSKSPELPSTTSSDWCALTACGHIYHINCISHWFKGKTGDARKCPMCNCSSTTTSIKIGGKRKPLMFVKLYFEAAIQSDPASQFIDEIEEEEEEEEEGEEGEKGMSDVEKKLWYLRNQVRELGNSLRSVKGQKDQLQRQLDSGVGVRRGGRVGPYGDGWMEEEEFENENERLDAEERLELIGFRERADEIEDDQQHEFEVNQLEDELDGRREEIVRLEAELQQYVLGQPDRVLIIDGLEKELSGAHEEIARLKKDLVEEKEDTRRVKLEWGAQRRGLVERINAEGNEGATKIKKLKEEAAVREELILKLRLDNDRLEILTKQKIKDLEAKHLAATLLVQDKCESARISQTLAVEEATAAKNDRDKIMRSLKSWQNKYEKKKLEAEELRLQATTRIGIVSPPSSSNPSVVIPRKHRIASSSTSPLPFKINSNKLSNDPLPRAIDNPKRKFLELSSDSDEDESTLHPASPSKRKIALPTLRGVGGSSTFGRANEPLSFSKSDKYLPDFAKGTIGALKAKTKIKANTVSKKRGKG